MTNLRKGFLLTATLGLAIVLAVQAPVRSQDPPPDPTPQPGVDVLARGPVHEAYAQPSDARPLPSVVIPKQPPAAIDEIPPDQKPEGDNVQWIPGYWAYDEEQKDFLWVSGFWRIPPPNHQWVPGSWQVVDGGYQWTAGFWATTGQEQVDYLPAPPPSIDAGPSTPAPNDNNTYAPGCWVYREHKYAWRPGFWYEFKPNWVWIPARYVWTPGGYVFVDGYWDHPLEQRGLLFAPVRINRELIVAGWTYTPQYCIQSDFLISALFVRGHHCHYYFGDYFEDAYTKRGFVPWMDYRIAKETFDPNFAYYRHRFSGDDTWERGLRDLYAGRFKGEIPRPPRTLVQQNTVIRTMRENKTEGVAVLKNINISHVQNVTVLAPITRLNNTKVTNLASLGSGKAEVHKIENHVIKVEPLSKEHKVEIQKAIPAYHAAAQQRHDVETKILVEGHTPVKAADPPKVVKIELPKTPMPSPQPNRPQPLPVREPPKPPPMPKHEDRPIPPHEPPALPKKPVKDK